MRSPLPSNLKTPRWIDSLVVRSRERHVAFLRRYLATFFLTVIICSGLFHLAMYFEGQSYGWHIGPYWTVSTMTTLGLGDIAFTSWPGLLLTSVTVIVGLVFMLVLLPLLLIQFPPWVEARSAARVRRRLSADRRGHVVLTNRDPVTEHFVERLRRYGMPYVLLVPDAEEAVRLADLGWSVLAGDIDHPETYRAARLDQAGLLAVTGSDVRNSNAVFTARSVAPEVPILSIADQAISVEVLQLAGSSRVLHLTAVMARGLARRVLGGDALAHVVARFDDVLIAEANAARTPLVGKRLRDTKLHEFLDVSIVGVWDRGEFEPTGADTEIGPHTVLVLAGTREQLAEYDAAFAIYNVSVEPVLVIGGGRVGRATAQALSVRGIDYRIIEREPELCLDERYIQGEAADPATLDAAGLALAPTVVITTHDDDTNVFLALYCRRRRPDVHIVSRATFDKNVETLHRAGTDFVLSSASLGADALFKLLEGGDVATLTEGLNLFEIPVPAMLAGKSLSESDLRRETGCTIVALRTAEGTRTNPDPDLPLPADAEALLIGTRASEAKFFERYAE